MEGVISEKGWGYGDDRMGVVGCSGMLQVTVTLLSVGEWACGDSGAFPWVCFVLFHCHLPRTVKYVAYFSGHSISLHLYILHPDAPFDFCGLL